MTQRKAGPGTWFAHLCLFAIAAGLAGLNWRLLTTAVEISPSYKSGQSQIWSPPDVSAKHGVHISRPAPVYRQIIERPLFVSNRRAFVEQPAKISPPPKKIPLVPASPVTRKTVLLIGIMFSENTRRALLKTAGEENVRWLHEGENIGGWQIMTINKDFVTLSGGKTRRDIALYGRKP